MYKLIAFILLTLNIYVINAQVKTVATFQDEYTSYLRVFPINKDKVVSLSHQPVKREPIQIYKFKMFDDQLREISEQEFKVHSFYGSPIVKVTDSFVTALFQDERIQKFLLVSYNVATRELGVADGKLPKKNYVVLHKNINNVAFVSIGRFRYFKPASENYFKIKLKTLKTEDKDYAARLIELKDFSKEKFNNRFYIEKNNGYHVKKIKPNGVVEEFPVFGDIPNPSWVKIKNVDTSSFIVYGKYTNMEEQGVFIVKVVDGHVIFSKKVDYFHMNSFYENKPDWAKDDDLKKAARKKNKGKNRGIYYDFIPYLVLNDDSYYITLEFFYETTKTVRTYDSFRDRYDYEQVFDGFNYTNAITIKFDENGNNLWDNNLKFKNDVKPFSHRKHVFHHFDEDKHLALYKTKYRLYSYYIERAEVFNEIELTDYHIESKNRPEIYLYEWGENNYILEFSRFEGKRRIKESSTHLNKLEVY